jgi:hypothetical protein
MLPFPTLTMMAAEMTQDLQHFSPIGVPAGLLARVATEAPELDGDRLAGPLTRCRCMLAGDANTHHNPGKSSKSFKQ